MSFLYHLTIRLHRQVSYGCSFRSLPYCNSTPNSRNSDDRSWNRWKKNDYAANFQMIILIENF